MEHSAWCQRRSEPAAIHRVPDAVRRPLRRSAEPGPTDGTRGPRISSAPQARCAASAARWIELRAEMPVADFGDEIDEGPHLGRQQPRGRIDDVDRQRWLLEFLQHYPEPAGLDRFRRLIGQHPRQAAALRGILDRGVGTVGGETRRARPADLSAMLDKVPVRRGGRGAELYRLVDSDRLRRARLTAPLEIAG